MADMTITLTEEAYKNIECMQHRVWDIENKYGALSTEATKASWSFIQMLMTIMRWPGKVMAEDKLSLLINSSITIGIIWHPVRHKMEDGSVETDPLLGEWSSHS